MPWMPTPSRAAFIMPNMPAMPALAERFSPGLGGVGLGPQPPGDGVVEIQHAGRLRLDAHLLLDAAGVDAIARAHLAVFARRGISAP